MILITQQGELILNAAHASAVGQVQTLLEEAGVQVLATSPHDGTPNERLMLVVDDPNRARALLARAGLASQMDSVLLIEAPRQPGLLAHLGQRLWSQGIGICHSYISARTADTMAAVFKTTDDRRAYELLQTTPPGPGGAAARLLRYGRVKLVASRQAA